MTDFDPKFTEAFGDGVYQFRLCGLAEWTELEAKVGQPMFVIAERLRTRQCGALDIYEPIRLALIGGGLKPVDALILCKRYILERPLAENWGLALKCIDAALFGPEEYLEKKAKAAGEQSQPGTEG